MNIPCSIALNLLSIIYMLVLLISLRHKHKWETLNHQYCQLVLMICAFLLLDILYMVVYTSADPFAYVTLTVIKSIYFIVNSVIVWIWARYVDYTIFSEEYKTKKHLFYYTSVLLINMGIVIINSFTGFLFQIAPNKTFVVGYTMMWAFTILNYSSLFLTLILLIKHREKMKRNIFLTLLIFPLPPLIAEIIQIFYRSYSLICTYAVSALIIFQNAQNNTIYSDELTGLANRRLLNESLQNWFFAQKGAMICGIMIDLDGLKHINDTYGHLSGDDALMTVGEILRRTKSKNMIAGRYGGDEFILLWLSKDGLDLGEVEQKLEKVKTQVNALKPEHKKIDFSTGSFCCYDHEHYTADQFLQQIDDQMYRTKKRKKEIKKAERT